MIGKVLVQMLQVTSCRLQVEVSQSSDSQVASRKSQVASLLSPISYLKHLVILLISLICSITIISAQTEKDIYWVYMDSGSAFYQERALDSALYYYNMAIEIDETAADGFFRRALVREKLDDFDGANEDYLKAILLKPQPVYYSNLGLNKSIKGENEEALEYFNKAINMDPEYMQAYMNRGIAWHYLGDMEKACEDVNKAYKLGFGLAKQYLEENCGGAKEEGSGQ